jgi:hypothetical protein
LTTALLDHADHFAPILVGLLAEEMATIAANVGLQILHDGGEAAGA